MECALVRALDHAPDGLHPVGVDVLSGTPVRVLDRLVVKGNPGVLGRSVRIDRDAWRRALDNDVLKGQAAHNLGRTGRHLCDRTISLAHYWGLAHGATAAAHASEHLAHGPGHLVPTAIPLSRLHLDWSSKHLAVGRYRGPQPVREELGGSPRDFKVARELRARNRLQAGRHYVGRHKPSLLAQHRALHDGAYFGAE